MFYIEPFVQITTEVGFSYFANSGYNTNLIFPPHTHSIVEILFFVEGEHRVLCDGREYVAKEGDVLLIRSFAAHELYGNSGGLNKHYALQISAALLFNLSFDSLRTTYLLSLSEANGNSKSLWTKEECDRNGLTALFSDFHKEFTAKSFGYDIACISIISQILLTIIRESDNYSIKSNVSEDIKRRIYDCMIFMRRNFKEDLTEEICAKNISLSRCYFSRNFKAVTGRSFKEYLNLVRIEHANTLLSTTELTVSEIASICGFSSASHFIYTYKKSQNITPLAFRNKNKR